MGWEEAGLASLLALAALAAWRRDPSLVGEALAIAGRTLAMIAPILVLALLAAGFLGEIIPERAIAAVIGSESGVTGVLIGSLVGTFIPGGPMVSFPLVVALAQAGAGPAQLVAFISAWGLIAAHRLVAYELPLMGPRFVRRRMLVSAVLPPLSGLTALALHALLF